MQTLGLSDSTPRTENRLKSLFWPSIQSGADMDYLGSQGYWICMLVAVMSVVVLVATGHLIAGLFTFLFYYVGGIGVRERSLYAAAIVFVMFALEIVGSGVNVVRVLFAAVLLSNLRAVWIASRWKPESEEASLPARLNETWTDKLADQLPLWLWPKVRFAFYVFSAGYLAMVLLGLSIMVSRRIA
jgi:hypothetical protein